MNVHRSQQADLIKKVTRVAKGILVTSILSLLLVLVLVTLPKIESSRFKLGICSVTATKLITAQDKRLQCDCIKRNTNAKCTIYYPCLQIYVSYNNRSEHDALVVRDRRQITKECSYILRDSECKTTADVYKHVNVFLEQWGSKNSSYKCYHNPRIPARVILINNALSTVLAATLTLISSVGVVIGLLLFCLKKQISLIMFKRVRRLRGNEQLVSLAQGSAIDDEIEY